jgi:hypothetical protein
MRKQQRSGSFQLIRFGQIPLLHKLRRQKITSKANETGRWEGRGEDKFLFGIRLCSNHGHRRAPEYLISPFFHQALNMHDMTSFMM